MIQVYGKIRTLVYLLSPIDAFELENTITHEKSDIEFERIGEGTLYYVYSMDFRYMDYGEYQYRASLEDQVQETGLFRLCHETAYATPEDEPQIVMYDGNESNENIGEALK